MPKAQQPPLPASMDRDQRTDDRRRREDKRDHRSRNGAPPFRSQESTSADKRPDRDRSRSPPPRERRDDRRRDRSPPHGPKNLTSNRSDRDRDRDSHRGRERQGSGTPPPRRPGDRDNRGPPRQPLDSRSGNTSNTKGRADSRRDAPPPDTRMQDGLEDEDEETEMQRIMGFHNFRTTKNTKVPGNEKNFAVYKVKKTEYRQYMNRQGGFNRPLSPTRN